MARFNEILVGRFNRGVQKLFGIKGGPPAPQLATEIGINHSLLNGVENRYLEGWDRFTWSIAFPAGGAGNTNQMQIRVPKGAGLIVVIEKISAFSGVQAGNLTVSRGQPAGDLVGAGAPANTRQDARGRNAPGSVTSQAQAVTSNLAVPIDQLAWLTNTIAIALSFENQEITILPGDAVRLNGNAANVAENYTLWWRERALEEGEQS